MIPLTTEQAQALQNVMEDPPLMVNPENNKEYVLVPKDIYDRLRIGYDDSPWTDEEMDMLAAEDADLLGWEGMDIYQDK